MAAQHTCTCLSFLSDLRNALLLHLPPSSRPCPVSVSRGTRCCRLQTAAPTAAAPEIQRPQRVKGHAPGCPALSALSLNSVFDQARAFRKGSRGEMKIRVIRLFYRSHTFIKCSAGVSATRLVSSANPPCPLACVVFEGR